MRRRLLITSLALFGVPRGMIGVARAAPEESHMEEAKKQLAPTGTLRAAINFGNPVLAQRDPASGEPRGVSADLAREIARRLGVPLAFVPFNEAGAVTDALASGVWDVAFLAIDPGRAAGITFTAPYVLIEGTYVVPATSPLRTVEDVDRDGVRVAVALKSAYDLFLSRTLKHAVLVRSDKSADAVTQFRAEHLDALAGVKQPLQKLVAGDPTLRLMEGRFMVISQAVATPNGRPAGARFLRDFVEQAKASGFVAAALARSGQADAEVAPADPTP
jgi:polar amino acid transport system substrate-binding protein